MLELKKTPGKDFIILNLTDPHFRQGEDRDGSMGQVFVEEIFRYTLDKLLEEVKPDLITTKNYEEITRLAAIHVEKVQTAKKAYRNR